MSADAGHDNPFTRSVAGMIGFGASRQSSNLLSSSTRFSSAAVLPSALSSLAAFTA